MVRSGGKVGGLVVDVGGAFYTVKKFCLVYMDHRKSSAVSKDATGSSDSCNGTFKTLLSKMKDTCTWHLCLLFEYHSFFFRIRLSASFYVYSTVVHTRGQKSWIRKTILPFSQVPQTA